MSSTNPFQGFPLFRQWIINGQHHGTKAMKDPLEFICYDLTKYIEPIQMGLTDRVVKA